MPDTRIYVIVADQLGGPFFERPSVLLVTVRYLIFGFSIYLFRLSVDYIKVKCGRCLMGHPLEMIYALSRFDPMGTRTGVLGVSNLHANHYPAGIGKEKAPNFPDV